MTPSLTPNSVRILAQKALFFTVSAASVAVSVEFTLLNFDFPALWSALDSYTKPPYLYLLINIIILTISATSHLHQQENQSPSSFLQVPTEDSFGIFDSVCVPRVFEESESPIVGVEVLQQIINCSPLPESTLISPENEKPVINSGIAQRKRTKTNLDGARSLKVAKMVAEEDDGRQSPVTRQLKRSETLGPEMAAGSKKKKVARKSVTLRDRTNYDNEKHRPPSPDSGGKVRKYGSLSNDELNRRIEEFIRKFNNEMRMQREESVRALTNCGTHNKKK